MDESQADPNRALMLDGNAAAGILQEVFALEMTASPTECDHCGYEGQVGTLLAFVQSPGFVLRCPACEHVIMRIVATPDAFYLDTRGAAYLRLERRTSPPPASSPQAGGECASPPPRGRLGGGDPWP
jgi:hypothetical protein